MQYLCLVFLCLFRSGSLTLSYTHLDLSLLGQLIHLRMSFRSSRWSELDLNVAGEDTAFPPIPPVRMKSRETNHCDESKSIVRSGKSHCVSQRDHT